MNWRRGLLRLWLALTIVWVAVWVVAVVVRATYWGPEQGSWEGYGGMNLSALPFVAVIVVPPVVVFGVGWLVLWVFRGFRPGKG